MPNSKAVFLDRDGTIIYDTGYPKDPETVQLLVGVIEALSFIEKQGYKLIIVSNQSGIGRGILSHNDVKNINDRIISILKLNGITINGVYYCPHAPDEKCACRKPSPAMIIRGAIEHDVDPKQSFMIGDKIIDIETGKRAGCRTILIGQKFSAYDNEILPDFFAKDWYEVLSIFSKWL